MYEVVFSRTSVPVTGFKISLFNQSKCGILFTEHGIFVRCLNGQWGNNKQVFLLRYKILSKW